jgi:hypothetical protein
LAREVCPLSTAIFVLSLKLEVMVVPAFGFSIGDFIASIKIVTKISKALKESGGAAEEYQSLVTELQQLQVLLEQLRDLPSTSSDSLSHHNAVRGMAYQVQVPLRAFVKKMESYDKKLGSSANTDSWRSSKRKAQWAISMREDIREMRAAITMKIVAVSLLIAIPTG